MTTVTLREGMDAGTTSSASNAFHQHAFNLKTMIH